MSNNDDGAATLSSKSDSHPTPPSDTSSGSSHAGNAAPDAPACPYQTSESFGDECSRFYDCPTHNIARERTDVSDSGTVSPDSGSQDRQPVARPEHDGMVEAGISSADSSTETHIPALGRGTAELSSSSAGPTISNAGEASLPTLPSLGLERHPPPMSYRPGLHTGATSPRDISRDATLPTMDLPEGHLPTSVNPIPSDFALRPETGRSAREFSLPRWQPDSEATYCPICYTQFSFFVRKHHCRKCGRVVCSACSPHRITIPHQYIVRLPGERAFAQRYSFLGGEGGIADFSALGGGEQVRLCNPCVPDPNTTPPHTQHPLSPHQRSHSSSSGTHHGDSNTTLPSILAPANIPHNTHNRNRSSSMAPGPMTPWSFSGPHPYPSLQRRVLARGPYGQHDHAQVLPQAHPLYGPSSGSGSPITAHYHYPNLPPGLFQMPPLRAAAPHREPNPLYGQSSSSSASLANRFQPPIPEEDECPVCHRELPSRSLDNFEALRESHITSCIESHSAYGPGQDAPGRSGSREPRAPRLSGIFPYKATEKDCVDSAECTICLEEFEVGVKMARLECLCRFHRSCISEWFVSHPGRCPMHQALQY
ncbi:FYVE-domain-containing protein [Hypoxylon sp. FL1284]|nr:FYVE-domain-containing protein [Hypoxylon sp. FL1284]